MLRSLRSQLIIASLLWTSGLLGVLHVGSMLLIHVFPQMRDLHSAGVIVLGLVLMSAAVVVLRRSLLPFRSLREKLAAVRAGQKKTMDGPFPSEIRPLIDELNALLRDRDAAVNRARATAGDLAHGLKTPLALLAQIGERASESGDTSAADAITQQVERMSRQVNYHLARARAAASAPTRAAECALSAVAEALVRTLAKLHAERRLDLSSNVSGNIHVQVQREDLDEILGNLLDNACKWATSRVIVSATVRGEMTVLSVDDDGPGLAPEARTQVLERGVRLDEKAPGAGLGLAIVRDLCELYSGSITLGESHLGGLRASVFLPPAQR